MEIKIFSDLVDVLGKVANGLKALSALPKAERDKYRETLDETYGLIDAALNMVIIRLGDVLLYEKDHEFVAEVAKLDNMPDWLETERRVRICSRLRAAKRETTTLRRNLAGQLSTNDWDSLLDNMEAILRTEGELAEFISTRFSKLSQSVDGVADQPQKVQAAREEVKRFREALKLERRCLIEQETQLYEIV